MSRMLVLAVADPELPARVQRDPPILEDLACDALQAALDAERSPDEAAVRLGRVRPALEILVATVAGRGSAAHQALSGGDRLPMDARGFEEIRLVAPEAVRSVHEALGCIPEDALRSAFDVERQVDEGVCGVCPDVERLVAAFRRLRGLYAAAADRGRAVLMLRTELALAPL